MDPGEGPQRRDARTPRGGAEQRDEPRKRPREASLPGEAAWFRLNIGRKKNADPKWLLPMLCRRGNISKQDIGAIRIFDHETKVEIAQAAAADFAANMARPSGDNIRAERSTGQSTGARTPLPHGRKSRRPHKPKQKKAPDA